MFSVELAPRPAKPSRFKCSISKDETQRPTRPAVRAGYFHRLSSNARVVDWTSLSHRLC